MSMQFDLFITNYKVEKNPVKAIKDYFFDDIIFTVELVVDINTKDNKISGIINDTHLPSNQTT